MAPTGRPPSQEATARPRSASAAARRLKGLQASHHAADIGFPQTMPASSSSTSSPRARSLPREAETARSDYAHDRYAADCLKLQADLTKAYTEERKLRRGFLELLGTKMPGQVQKLHHPLPVSIDSRTLSRCCFRPALQTLQLRLLASELLTYICQLEL
mmetsp:Transcript_9725/g.13658  ORF Transcript_9725/g.13658 Transcript_9725/m.13658 type:complete len:159 (+) Transcript_9725:132-608(+)